MTGTRPAMRSARRRRVVAGVVGAVAIGLLLGACTPEPPAASPPPPSSSSRPECGSAEATAVDAMALTVENRRGERKVIEVDPADLEDKLAKLASNGKAVLDVEPEQPVSVAAVDDPYYAPAGPGGHPEFGQWGLERIRAEAAWAVGGTQGRRPDGSRVVVAVVDTGVQADHPGLAGQVLPGRDYIAAAPFDGRVDGHGHGTHVAGIIADKDDAAGGIGVAPGVVILPVRVLGCGGTGTNTAVADGIRWAVSQGADVINLSLSTTGNSSVIRSAVDDALASGVVVAAAAGNGGGACASTLTRAASAPDEDVPAPASPPADPGADPGADDADASDAVAAGARPSSPAPDPAAGSTATGDDPAADAAGSTATGDDPAADGAADEAPATSTTSTSTTSSTTSTTTTSTTTAPPAVEAPAPVPSAPVAPAGDGAPPAPDCSVPHYPAALAGPARPGLLAAASTAIVGNLTAPVSGKLTWKKGQGQAVAPGDVVATIAVTVGGAPTNAVAAVTSLVAGVLDRQLVANGAVVQADQAFGTIRGADVRSTFSNVNDYVRAGGVAAPGGGVPKNNEGIWSTLNKGSGPYGAYGYMSGTSMATPHVAGAAALILAACPGLDGKPAQVAAALRGTATDLGAPGADPEYGAGLIRADAAVAAAC